MSNQFKDLSQSARWALMVGAVVKGAEEAGWGMTRKPGRGLSNTWLMEKDGKQHVAAIRTSQDRWLAFPPLEGGAKWKTLDASEFVLVGVVDHKEQPTFIQVYLFSAAEVRKRFDAAYKARNEAGHVIMDNYGFWVNLEPDDRDLPMAVGAGIVADHVALAEYAIADLLAAKVGQSAATIAAGAESVTEAADDDLATPVLATIADVMTWARDHISRIAAVPAASVSLDLKIQY